MNYVVQQAIEADIYSFFKKAKSTKKKNAEAKINDIREELDYLSFTGSVISAITSMEYIPVNAWNIGLEYNNYGAGLDKINHMDTDCINIIINRRIITNIKEVVGNYSFTQTKYSNGCFNVIDNARYS